MRSIEGRVVLVTGATAGIGRRTAERLADAGATVVGCARDELRLQEVRTRRPDLDLRHCDVADPDQRADLVAGVLADHGRIDVLVNNAGIGWEGLVEEMAEDDLERLYATNVLAPLDLTRRVLPGMLARRDGDVVMMSSGAAFLSVPPLTVYCSTKYAIDGFVEGLRREVWTRGVRVHSVNPGFVRTEWLARSAGYQPSEADGPHRLSRGAPPEWVAAAVHRSLTRPWSRTASVPRWIGLGRLLAVQPLRTAVDVAVGLNAARLARLGRGMAAARIPAARAQGWQR
ncbi:MAG TPA: SDR family oxidoreductase [Mycobacteriales bacterium]|nr:SDR family oxidoreductase [Mycobacteriales bacterium]